jgi:cytochrome c oxidase cbb3-type subunit 3
MRSTTALAGAAYLVLATLVVTLAAQGAPPQTSPTPPAAGAKPPAPAAPQGRGRGQGTFPAQQRPPGDPEVIKKGSGLYGVYCRACHGTDLRGGDQGGPNLLRSQVVLNDQNGELLLPIVQNGRQSVPGGPLMPPLPIPEEDVRAIATFIHSVTASARGQGAPPAGPPVELNIVVGDPKAGQAYFTSKCTACHKLEDMQGIATRIDDPVALQNHWVGGGGRGGRNGGPPTPTTATVTEPSGQKLEGRLVRIDDFMVVIALEDGRTRSFRRDGGVPKVEIRNPREAHLKLLPTYSDKDIHDVTAFLVTLK